MRTLVLAALAFLPALTLGGCASSGAETSTAARPANDDVARLRRDCDARGGIIVSSGRLSGEPALDNICKITGAPTRAP